MSNIQDLPIAVLMGGPGSEREVSLASGQAVALALKQAGAVVSEVDVVDDSFVLPEETAIAFNVIHGHFGEDGSLQEILEARNIPYTGAGVAASRLAFDKEASKAKFVKNDVPTPESLMVPAGSQGVEMPLPLVIKPPKEGSSVGVHIVSKAEELIPALDNASQYGEQILVEEFIDGKELTVGVLGETALPIVQIQPRDGFYDMSNKYPWMNEDESSGSDYFCPADLSEQITAEVQRVALAAHHCLGIDVYSRVDVLLDQNDKPYVLEVNTLPGMTETSLLPKAAACAGDDFPSLCAKIVQLSLNRHLTQ